MQNISKLITQNYINLVFFISFVAVIGSFALSNVVGLTPCELCWYQRIFMFPIPIVTGIALLVKDKHTAKYVAALSVIGLAIASYHYAIQMTDLDSVIPGCSPSNPCNQIEFELVGFITIPLMSGVAFLLLAILSWWKLRNED